jgi:hypothetical protein
MKPFLVTVVLNPTKKQAEDGENPVIVVNTQTILAKDEQNARVKGARLVPPDHADKDDRLEVFVMPFLR